jgi:Tol biopolymer transport system component
MIRSTFTAALRLTLMLAAILCGGGLAARALPGAVIAFNDVADRGGRIRSIAVIDANRPDLGAREWTRHVPQPFYYHQPNLSLDGRRLVYFSRATGRATLYDLAVRGADGTALATDGNSARVVIADADNLNVNPVWSADGRYLAYASARGTGLDIYVLRAAPGAAEQRVVGSAEHESRPAWSPDGRALAYQVWLPQSVELFIVGIAEGAPRGTPRRLTDNRAVDAHPAWSPDGRQIAYESNEWTRGSADIAVIDVETGARRPVTPRDPSNDAGIVRYTQPVWLADGRQIAFIAIIGERSYLAVTSVDAAAPAAIRLLAPTRTDALWALWFPAG